MVVDRRCGTRSYDTYATGTNADKLLKYGVQISRDDEANVKGLAWTVVEDGKLNPKKKYTTAHHTAALDSCLVRSVFRTRTREPCAARSTCCSVHAPSSCWLGWLGCLVAYRSVS